MENRRDWSWIIIVMTLLVAIISLGFYSLVTGKNLSAIEIVLTALLLKFGTLIDYRYGSSKGSREKTEMLTEQSKKTE